MEHASSSEALAEPEDTARDESLQQSSDLGQAFKWFVGDCREGRRLHSTTFGPLREQGCSRPAFRFVEGPPWRTMRAIVGATRQAFCFLLIQFILTVPTWPNLLDCRSS